MEKFSVHIYTFILPLFVANVIHMLIVKGKIFSVAAKPLSIALFGAGKTYRAFLVMPLICGLNTLLFRSLILHKPNHYWSFSIGVVLGLAYLIGEFPNSFVKRKLGIPSGQHSLKYKYLQNIIDKSDSLLAACGVYFFIAPITFRMIIWLFAVSFMIHVIFSWLLVQIKVKKSF